jgi:hypothetical protein
VAKINFGMAFISFLPVRFALLSVPARYGSVQRQRLDKIKERGRPLLNVPDC